MTMPDYMTYKQERGSAKMSGSVEEEEALLLGGGVSVHSLESSPTLQCIGRTISRLERIG